MGKVKARLKQPKDDLHLCLEQRIDELEDELDTFKKALAAVYFTASAFVGHEIELGEYASEEEMQ